MKETDLIFVGSYYEHGSRYLTQVKHWPSDFNAFCVRFHSKLPLTLPGFPLALFQVTLINPHVREVQWGVDQKLAWKSAIEINLCIELMWHMD